MSSGVASVMVCAVCGRDQNGFGVLADKSGCDDYLWACSATCQGAIIAGAKAGKPYRPVFPKSVDEIKKRFEVIMRVKTTDEFMAVGDAITSAGAYLETIKVTDLSQMTAGQFREFITLSALTFCAGLSARAMKSDEIPF